MWQCATLQSIWKRALDPENSENSIKMKNAIAKSLSECSENATTTVCITGRSNKLLSSIATLDKDPTIGVAYSYEMYRNEILDKFNNHIKEKIESDKKSMDPARKQYVESFTDLSIDQSPAEKSKFNNELKTYVDALCKDYKMVVRDYNIEKIKQECNAVIDNL